MKAPAQTPDWLREKIRSVDRLWLFSDYDGTLAEFTPDPREISPRKDVIHLLAQLVHMECLRLAIVSGRSLKNLHRLVPLQGVVLAGVYGVEISLPDGRQILRARDDGYLRALEFLRSVWQPLLHGHEGFILEDKGWALAIHGSNASEKEAGEVLKIARELAERNFQTRAHQILTGQRFLEICPPEADKGRAIEFLLDYEPFPGALPLYIGDDDKDEKAFHAVHQHNGVAIRVGMGEARTEADWRLATPMDARAWLAGL